MSRSELLRRFTSSELSEALIWEKMEPRGDARLDYWMSHILALLANYKRDRLDPPIRPGDLIPAFDGGVRPQSPDDMRQAFDATRATLDRAAEQGPMTFGQRS